MYMDGGSASEVLYEHCFNKLRPKVKIRMIQATSPLLGFRGENILAVRADLTDVGMSTVPVATKRRVDRLTPGTINTWDLLKKAFIQRYCPPSKTVKQLEDIHNFKQEGDESLYQAWERYNDLLYKCPTQDINGHQKTMADHSHKSHDGTTSRNVGSNSSNDGLAALVNKLDNLRRDIKKLKESVHVIQVGCQICEGPHLDKDCPLNEEVKQVKEVRYGEFGRTTLFNRSNGGKFRVGPPGYYTKTDNRPPYGERRPSLEELLANH
ncbi:cysteine-rich receptor-like protein kinase [Tanacetum coccineum]